MSNEVYRNNDLDKGHMVRRLDPVWGSEPEAQEANEDTFHYTNACPQDYTFNDEIWGELEDYILDSAAGRGAHQARREPRDRSSRDRT